MTRPRGTGSIRSRNGWLTIKYYVDGVPVREAAKTRDAAVAQALLNRRLGAVANGKVPSPKRERVKLGTIFDNYLLDLALNNRRDQGHAKRDVAKLKAFFGENRRANSIRVEDVRRYILDRRTHKPANEARAGRVSSATVNRELAVLRRAFNLALESDLIERAPKFRLLKEPPPRSGFFERERFDAVWKHLRFEVVRDVATFGYWLGWRIGEILALEPRHVDLHRRCLVLEPGRTKGGEGRIVYPPPPAWEVIAKWYGKRAEDGRIASRLFHRRGRPILTIQTVWRSACRKAGCPGMRFHDLRRTAVRNMVRSGIAESVAMKITGHRTRSVFERYNITTDDDVKAAAEKMTNGSLKPSMVKSK